MTMKSRLTPQDIAAWLTARAQAHRERSNYYAAIYIYIKRNSNVMSASDFADLELSDALFKQHLDACAALEDAAETLMMGRSADDLPAPAILPRTEANDASR
ncbi:MAG: hypothetical protein ACK4SA_20180 [Caldilinea sp.]